MNTLSKINKKRLLNPYLIIGVFFVVWMYFFDDNSVRIHRELNREIDDLESSIRFYDNEIQKDRKILQLYENRDSLEKFAREKYGLKKENEDIYIIDNINE